MRIDEAINNIPKTVYHLGSSPAISSQLNIAPIGGIINFQTLISETLTSGRLSTINHNENATAEIKLNHPKER